MTPSAEIRNEMVGAMCDAFFARGIPSVEIMPNILKAAILALEAHGGRVTMREATEEMLNAVADWTLEGDAPTARHVWTDMHTAAPKWGDE